jgi:hypothetical protein
LVLLANSPSRENLNVSILIAVLPVIITSLQANVALDESLAVLITVLYPASSSTDPTLPLDVIVPLSTILPSLCSAHPDAPTRHLAFRLLGRLLQLTPPALRLHILRDLLAPSDDAFPQMRAAAIGLAKDLIVEALNASIEDRSNAPSVFATPIVLQAIGPFVFRPEPLDLFELVPTLDKFIELPESKRLVECMGLYYILLVRDMANKVSL